MKDKQKYLTYEFDLARCEGRQVFGSNGKICQRSDTGEVLDTKQFHHMVINTVTPEPTQTAREAFAEVLWIVDISAPAERWSSLKKRLGTRQKHVFFLYMKFLFVYIYVQIN